MSDQPTPAADVSALPFEKAMAELEQIVGRLEKGDATLEESILIYERGETLRRHCEQLLHSAEMRIEKITLGSDGLPNGVTTLDPE